MRFSLFDNLLGNIAHDIGIDLGTAYCLVYVKGQGIVINEPSVVAINKKSKQILAIGDEAKKMVGRTPSHIVAIRPLVDGVVSDFEVTEAMLKYFIEKVQKTRFSLVPRPRVVIGIPYGVTEVERRAVEEAALNAGARQVYLIEEPMAAAIGANLPVQEATGNLIVDIGGGTTEVAVISLGGIVTSRSLRVAGDELNDDIIAYARDQFNLLLGERTAEDIKISIGSAYPQEQKLTYPMRGRDLITGLPKEIIISDEEIRKALTKSVAAIVDAVKLTVEETPPELLADIMDRGVILAGGGALLRGLDKLLQDATHIPVYIADDPLGCVARGTGQVLENLDHLQAVLLPAVYR
jgi:rod shape-determining protein MreB